MKSYEISKTAGKPGSKTSGNQVKRKQNTLKVPWVLEECAPARERTRSNDLRIEERQMQRSRGSGNTEKIGKGICEYQLFRGSAQPLNPARKPSRKPFMGASLLPFLLNSFLLRGFPRFCSSVPSLCQAVTALMPLCLCLILQVFSRLTLHSFRRQRLSTNFQAFERRFSKFSKRYPLGEGSLNQRKQEFSLKFIPLTCATSRARPIHLPSSKRRNSKASSRMRKEQKNEELTKTKKQIKTLF